MKHSSESNSAASAEATILCNEFENGIFELTATLPGAGELSELSLLIYIGHKAIHYTVASRMHYWCKLYETRHVIIAVGYECINYNHMA